MSKKTLEEMMMLPYETLCDMALKGEITWSEWIEHNALTMPAIKNG